MTCMLVASSSFLSGSAYPYLNFLPHLSLSLPDPYSDHLGIKILLNNSLVSFFNVYAPPVCFLTDTRTDSFSYTFSIFSVYGIPFLLSGRHLLLLPFIRWERLWTLLLSSGLSLSPAVSKLFERIILSRLLFFLESNSILSPHQAGFRPGRYTLNQIMLISQSILDCFNKSRPDFRMILANIDFSKAFDSVWPPALLHKPT